MLSIQSSTTTNPGHSALLMKARGRKKVLMAVQSTASSWIEKAKIYQEL